MPQFNINPDISLAETLSSEFYNEDKYFELSKEKIFSRSWQYCGDTGVVKVPGQIHPFYLLENYLSD